MADINTSFYPQANPNALLGIAGNVVNLAQGATQAQQSRVDLVKSQVGYLVDGFSALASKPDLTQQDFIDFGQRALREGIISPDVYEAEAANIAKAGNDPQALRGLATNFGLRALDAGQRFAQQFGTFGQMDTGNTIQPFVGSVLTGIHPLGAPIQKTLSPSELAAPTQIGVTPDNRPITGTMGQLLEKAGVNPLTALPMAQPSGGNPLMPSMPGQPVPQQPAAPGTVVVPPPGAVEAQTAAGQASGADLAAARTRESTFQQDVTPLLKAIPALEELGTTGTGPGTEQINEIASFLQSMGVPGIDATRIKNFDEVKKYLSQFAQVGNPNTNDKLAAAFAANPSVGVSNAAAVDVAKTALALRRMQNAQVRAFDASGLPDAQFAKFVTQFNADQDPRAYGLDLMSPNARAKLINGLNGDEKAKFANSLRQAIALGLVTAPGGAGGQ